MLDPGVADGGKRHAEDQREQQQSRRDAQGPDDDVANSPLGRRRGRDDGDDDRLRRVGLHRRGPAVSLSRLNQGDRPQFLQ